MHVNCFKSLSSCGLYLVVATRATHREFHCLGEHISVAIGNPATARAFSLDLHHKNARVRLLKDAFSLYDLASTFVGFYSDPLADVRLKALLYGLQCVVRVQAASLPFRNQTLCLKKQYSIRGCFWQVKRLIIMNLASCVNQSF
jgi:hypothetical protein